MIEKFCLICLTRRKFLISKIKRATHSLSLALFMVGSTAILINFYRGKKHKSNVHFTHFSLLVNCCGKCNTCKVAALLWILLLSIPLRISLTLHLLAAGRDRGRQSLG